jgi:hypothetical protein
MKPTADGTNGLNLQPSAFRPSAFASSEAPWKVGLRGARANVVPGLALQALATAIAVGYYFHEPTRHALDGLSAFRQRTGFLYSVVATAFFGGALPFLYLWLQPATRGRYDLKQAAALTLLWAYKGFEVDLWYRFMAHAVGSEATFAHVITKTFLDQFVYCPIWAVPAVTWVYQYIESGFDARAWWADVSAPRWYARRALPNLISNMGVWVPTVCVVYSLPSSLQIPLFNLVLCFYTLLLAHIAATQAPQGRVSAAAPSPTVPVG